MAKPNWLTTTPTSGSGNGVIANSATAHTGRVARTGVVTVTGLGIVTPATYNVTLEPKEEFVIFNDGTETSSPQEGGNLTILGKSNSSSLTFSIVGEASGITLPATYLANGVATNNGSNITGDPGASVEFTYSIVINIPANSTVSEIERTIKVLTFGGQFALIIIKQTAASPALSISPTEITIPSSGSPAVNVAVTSNTSWTVS